MAKRKKYPKHESKVIKLTPEYAKELLKLAHTVKQRPTRPSRVKVLEEAIGRNLWGWTGEAIILDWNGIPRNGVHRLMAVVNIGKTIEVTISTGINPEFFKIIDTHAKRSARDALVISGESYCHTLATALNLYDQHLELKGGFQDGQRPEFQRQDMFDLLEKHPRLRKYVVGAERFHGQKLLSLGVVAAFHYIFATEINKQKADAFFEQLLTGENLTQHHPVYCLREALRKKLFHRRKDIIGGLIKAWNVYFEGGEMYNLVPKDPKNKERFPKIKGLRR